MYPLSDERVDDFQQVGPVENFKLFQRHESVRAAVQRHEGRREFRCLRELGDPFQLNAAHHFARPQELVRAAVHVEHRAAHAAQEIGDAVERRAGHERRVAAEIAQLGEFAHQRRRFRLPLDGFFGDLSQFFEHLDKLRRRESIEGKHLHQRIQRRQLARGREDPVDARQVAAHQEIGSVVEEEVVFILLHVFPFDELVRVVAGHAVSRPAQLFGVERFQHVPRLVRDDEQPVGLVVLCGLDVGLFPGQGSRNTPPRSLFP